MIGQVDRDNDGRVDYQEFLALFHPDDVETPKLEDISVPDHLVHPLLGDDDAHSEVSKP